MKISRGYVLLGVELRRTREKACLSVEELSVCIGRSPGVIRAIEVGFIRPTGRYMDRLLDICGRDELWMMTTAPPPPA